MRKEDHEISENILLANSLEISRLFVCLAMNNLPLFSNTFRILLKITLQKLSFIQTVIK